jgi:hypothetical protein
MILTRENRKTLREICPSANLSTNPTWIDPVLRVKRQATSRLSHYTYYSTSEAPQSLEDSQQIYFYKVSLSASSPTPNLEDQASVFISPGDRVA